MSSLKGVNLHVVVIPEEIERTLRDEFRSNPESEQTIVKAGTVTENMSYSFETELGSIHLRLNAGQKVLYDTSLATQFKHEDKKYAAVHIRGVFATL